MCVAELWPLDTKEGGPEAGPLQGSQPTPGMWRWGPAKPGCQVCLKAWAGVSWGWWEREEQLRVQAGSKPIQARMRKQTALCLQVGGSCQVLALGRAEGVGTKSWCWACQGACAQEPTGSTSKKAGLGMQGQQRKETDTATGRPLRRAVMHSFKAVFQNKFHVMGNMGEIFLGHPQLCHTHKAQWEGAQGHQ